MTLKRAQNKSMPKDINSINFIITIKGIVKIESEKKQTNKQNKNQTKQPSERTSNDNNSDNNIVYVFDNYGKEFNILHLLVQFCCRQ